MKTRITHFLLLAIILSSMVFPTLPGQIIIPVTGSGTGSASTANLPTLADFAASMKNGIPSRVTGLYIEKLMALPVVQQPSDQPAFVSSTSGVVTQFQMATGYGSLGFLAHNYLAGAKFSEILVNALIAVVYGDGHYQYYKVNQVRRFQATQPGSPYSSFVDLASNQRMTGTQVFQQTYGLPGNLILQTCISRNGNDSWGRIFIIATPYVIDISGSK